MDVVTFYKVTTGVIYCFDLSLMFKSQCNAQLHKTLLAKLLYSKGNNNLVQISFNSRIA